jgi:small-conductance mechanosensitive channel
MINETIDIANASLHLLHSQNEKINSIKNSIDTLNEHIETSQTLLDTMLSFTYRIYYKYIKNKSNNADIYNDTFYKKKNENYNTICSIKHINKEINTLLEDQNKHLEKIHTNSISTNTNLININKNIKSI